MTDNTTIAVSRDFAERVESEAEYGQSKEDALRELLGWERDDS